MLHTRIHRCGPRLASQVSRSMCSTARRGVEARSIIYEANGEPTQIIRAHRWTMADPTGGQLLVKVGLAALNPAGGCRDGERDETGPVY